MIWSFQEFEIHIYIYKYHQIGLVKCIHIDDFGFQAFLKNLKSIYIYKYHQIGLVKCIHIDDFGCPAFLKILKSIYIYIYK